jgi:carbamoyl-phosphate synthase large subunit
VNILFCSIGKHGKIIEDIKKSLGKDSRSIATSNNRMVPSLYIADRSYMVPDVKDDDYIKEILDICKIEKIDAITTMLDVETLILSENRELFESNGIKVLTPYVDTARLCFDKYLMFEFCQKNNIKTILTFNSYQSFLDAFNEDKIKFPVFVKPNYGRGSLGARIIYNIQDLKKATESEVNLLIQEYIEGVDIDADVYVDTISQKAVSIFSKKKLETKIGGATKTISFKDNNLYNFVEKIVSKMQFSGPINIDLFYKDGQYFLTEINPRFGAGYIHAYGCGVDFGKLIKNNINGIENCPDFGNYEEDIIMMLFNSAILVRKSQLI